MNQKSEAVQLFTFLKWAGVLFCVLAPLAAYQSFREGRKAEAERLEAMRPDRVLATARDDFRRYAGSACESRAKRDLREPDSARTLSIGEPLLTDGGDAAFVVVSFSAKNGFGGASKASFGCSLRRVDGVLLPRVDAVTTISDGS